MSSSPRVFISMGSPYTPDWVQFRDELERLRSSGELVWSDLDSLLSGRYLRTLPGVQPCDGFFAAVLERSR